MIITERRFSPEEKAWNTQVRRLCCLRCSLHSHRCSALAERLDTGHTGEVRKIATSQFEPTETEAKSQNQLKSDCTANNANVLLVKLSLCCRCTSSNTHARAAQRDASGCIHSARPRYALNQQLYSQLSPLHA